MTGDLTLAGAPSSNLHAATKMYVDDGDAAALPKAGGTMTGALTLSGAPTENLHAATKKYVDDTATGITNTKGAANGIASLDANAQIPSAQIPSLSYIPTSDKAAASGVASLDSNTKLTAAQASAYIVAVSASKTLALTDAGTFQKISSSSAVTITVPTNTSVAFPVGTEIELYRGGSGSVTVAAASGVTINKTGSALTIAEQHGCAVLKKIDTNTWILGGALG